MITPYEQEEIQLRELLKILKIDFLQQEELVHLSFVSNALKCLITIGDSWKIGYVTTFYYLKIKLYPSPCQPESLNLSLSTFRIVKYKFLESICSRNKTFDEFSVSNLINWNER